MMNHGVPWQAVLADALMKITVFIIALILSLISGYFAWHSFVTISLLMIGFSTIVYLIPVFLNLSRSYFKLLASMLIIHIIVTICSFSLHYKSDGLIGPNGVFSPNYYDSLYFSITTFTTLGYGDFQPLPDYRLTTSLEALTGMISMAIGASFIWLWCQEHMVPKEMAFFDGNRRHKKSMSISRMRIRNLRGKDRELKNWVLPPKQGETYYFEIERQEWVQVTEGTQLPENALVIGVVPNEEEA